MSTAVTPALSIDPIATSRGLAERFLEGVAERDRERRFPHEQMAELKASGLLGVRLPRSLGGQGLDTRQTVRVVGELALGDPNIAQMFLIHLYGVELIAAMQGADALQRRLAERVLSGHCITNGFNETGTKTIMEFRTQVARGDDGVWRITGKKFYATGSLGGDLVYVVAMRGTEELTICWVDADAPGLTIHDDWRGMGQRTTASGTLEFDGVPVEEEAITGVGHLMTPESLFGNFGQIVFSAIFLGMARGALREGLEFVRTKARPRPEAGVDSAADDPYVLLRVGEMQTQIASGEGALTLALDARMAAEAEGTGEARDRASIAAGYAKVATGEAALRVSEGIFRVCGASSTLEKYGLDRHWRNARTLTLHDPMDWKLRFAGDYSVNGTPPPISPYT